MNPTRAFRARNATQLSAADDNLLDMRASFRLLQQCRITLFTRAHCGLCVQARAVLSDVWDARPFAFQEVDIIQPAAQGWRDLYEMDVPVIHISKAAAPDEDPLRASKAVKLMHRFSPDDVRAQMDRVESQV